MLSSIFLFSLDNTVLADLVPVIVNQFHRVDQIAWLSVGYVAIYPHYSAPNWPENMYYASGSTV